MSQITYFNVGVVAESYSNGALAYVDTQKGFIEDEKWGRSQFSIDF